jgi:palmitoyltransferase
MILFIVLHLLIIALVFFIVLPFLDSTAFSIGYLAVSGLVFILYFTLSFSNPGIMANKTYKDLLDVVEKGEDLENFCPYCIVKKKYKSLHCLVCQKCVDEFDHHCFWVGNCVGKNNYTLFFIFLIYVLLNTLFNVVLNIFFLATELASRTEIEYIMNNCFPGFYFGDKAFVYEKVFRIIVSSCIFIICVLFFIPLFNLFRMQLSTACEKRQLRREEEEYERNQLREKLDEEVWEDLVYEGDDNESESDLVELDVKNDDKNIDERPLLES